MVNHLALGIQAARLGARISAAEFVASLVRRTFGIDRALWFAIGWSSNKGIQAGAYGQTIGHPAFAVGSARRWIAGICNWWWGRDLHSATTGERISSIAVIADTVGHMVHSIALGVQSTDSGTRILALVADAGLVRGTIGA